MSQDTPPPRRSRAPRSALVPAGDRNRLLGALPPRDRASLVLHFEEVALTRSQVLFEPGQVPSHVHFPHAGTMISLVLPLQEGGTTETVTVGLEGAAGLGVDATDATVESYTRGVVQMPGAAARVPTADLARAAAASPGLRHLLGRHAEAALSMALQTAACNAQHPLRARLARWLLMAQDRAGDTAAPLPLTQEFLAEMIGVRRASVGEAALALQAARLVRLRRGGVQVLDRARLEGASCECHAAVRRRYARLLHPGEPEQGRAVDGTALLAKPLPDAGR